LGEVLYPTAAAVVVATFLFVVLGPLDSAAQSTNARPLINWGSADSNPDNISFLSQEGKKVLKDEIAAFKSGSIAAYVFSAGTDGKAWASRSINKGNLISVEDLARQSLETCEFYQRGTCYIVSLNGRDTRDAAGGFQVQPRMLMNEAGSFDGARVPFVSAVDRVALQNYTGTGLRVLAITTSGGWLWRSGDTAFQAIATASADCQKNYPSQVCILYAVNDRVVFSR
jgi:hypothetical protein